MLNTCDRMPQNVFLPSSCFQSSLRNELGVSELSPVCAFIPFLPAFVFPVAESLTVSDSL